MDCGCCSSADRSSAVPTAIRRALRRSGLAAAQIDYVNPHASGSRIGDATELLALRESGLAHAAINTTKSLTGHGLAAAGAVEVVATPISPAMSTCRIRA